MPDFRGKFVFSRQATTSLKSIHFTCVLGLVLNPHRKCPGKPREAHAKSERVAPRATVARHLRSEGTRIRGSPLIIEQTNSRATISRVAFGVIF